MSPASSSAASGPWLVVGTVPDESIGLLSGPCALTDGGIALGGALLPVRRGTPALLAAACSACQFLGIAPPLALLAGDAGRGEGSRKAYDVLLDMLPGLEPCGLTFHYLFPDLAGHDRVLLAIQSLPRAPLLVADAGFMYAAKMSGQAAAYDLFTPDAGELAFLADELAPHPFYTRGFLLGLDASTTELARRAWESGGAATYLLVKGEIDRIVHRGESLAEISEPQTPVMEAIGGTGDTLTGMITALLMAGRSIPAACALAALANRLLGVLARPTPATSVAELVAHVPEALRRAEGQTVSDQRCEALELEKR
ncbi:MAG: sugar kinase [Desulfovibrionaceae bacterium CG1_02_65_16]|nr:MAG: sugar kinase [Desulfovibrionaceae bacterium CG1_02_65_16]